MTQILNIALLAEHSTGKSSFLNALVGNVVAPTSIQRATMEIDVYQIRKNVPYANVHQLVETLENRHIENVTKRKQMEPIDFDKLKIPNFMEPKVKIIGSDINANIYDFPGLNDANDKDNIYLKIFEENSKKIDLILYMLDAKKPLTNTTEINQLHTILNSINELKNQGTYLELVIVINKFDEISDEDYLELYENLKLTIQMEFQQDIKIFRFCSHKFFVHNLKNHVKKIRIPKFYSKELQNIFRTSHVNITREIKLALIKNNPINCDDIEIMEDISTLDDLDELDDILENFNNKLPKFDEFSKEPEFGDWDNLISFIEDLNTNIMYQQTENAMKYLATKKNNLIDMQDMDSIQQLLITLNRMNELAEEKRIIFDLNTSITDICELLVENCGDISFIKNYQTELAHETDYQVNLVPIFLAYCIQTYSGCDLLQLFVVKILTDTEYRWFRERIGATGLMQIICPLLQVRNVDNIIISILDIINKYKIYDVASDILEFKMSDNLEVRVCECASDEIYWHKSFIINQILNNSQIKEMNDDLHQIIRTSVTPRIVLRIKINNIEFKKLLLKYFGDDVLVRIRLFIYSNKKADGDIMENSFFSNDSFIERQFDLDYYLKYI